MIELLVDLPDRVFGFAASGTVTSDDYQSVLLPALARHRAKNNRFRLLIQVGPGFRKFATTAFWDSPGVGLYRLEGIDRVAIVTDIGWICEAADRTRGGAGVRLRCFAFEEFDTAAAWLADNAERAGAN